MSSLEVHEDDWNPSSLCCTMYENGVYRLFYQHSIPILCIHSKIKSFSMKMKNSPLYCHTLQICENTSRMTSREKKLLLILQDIEYKTHSSSQKDNIHEYLKNTKSYLISKYEEIEGIYPIFRSYEKDESVFLIITSKGPLTYPLRIYFHILNTGNQTLLAPIAI